MKTPIYDFVSRYSTSDTVRMHMPGHKGHGRLGVEAYDITEINGADDLRAPEGIIAESEAAATSIFGTEHTYYLTEGSTLGIKAMLAVACPISSTVVAARNVHKAFVSAAAMLDLRIKWIYGEDSDPLCKCTVTPEGLERVLSSSDKKPAAVYVTSPDYLGNIANVGALAKVADKYGVPLLVDNAHGAYLRFLDPCLHPVHLGATMCCDSAHKTLPVLTGGAYLHVAKGRSDFARRAASLISVFASTSPSYLTLISLDLCNLYLADGYTSRLAETVELVNGVKHRLLDLGFSVQPSEPLKIVIKPADFGYSTVSLAEMMRDGRVEPEFVDSDFIVLMVSTDNDRSDLDRLVKVFEGIEAKAPISTDCPSVMPHSMAMTVREAVFAPFEKVSVKDAVGRISAAPSVSCPPAVPIVVSGEVITEADVKLLEKYGLDKISVVME